MVNFILSATKTVWHQCVPQQANCHYNLQDAVLHRAKKLLRALSHYFQ